MEAELRRVATSRSFRPTRRTLVVAAAVAVVVVGATLLAHFWRTRPIRAEVVLQQYIRISGSSRVDIVPLPAGASLVVDDELVASLSLDRPAYVYGFNADEADHFFAIFPLSGSTLKNPVPAGTSRLPGPMVDAGGEACRWRIDSVGTQENFIFFVAREPVPELQAMWDLCSKPSRTGGSSDGRDLRGTIRGAGGTGRFSGVISEDATKNLKDDLLRLVGDPSAVPGVTVLKETLANPGANSGH
jgi:hypothetical protein